MKVKVGRDRRSDGRNASEPEARAVDKRVTRYADGWTQISGD